LNPPSPPRVGYSPGTLAPPIFDTRTLVSFDGTPIAYHTAGRWNDDRAPVIVLANGLGGTYGAFRHQVGYLEKEHRFLTWDYRGLFGSARPRDPSAFTIDAHVGDMFAVLEAARVERAVLIGWSMGVQVSLEALKRRPELARGLVLLNGTFGRPFRTLPGGIVAERIAPLLILALRRYHGLTSSALRRVVGWPETIAWLKRLGMIGDTIDEDVFADTVAAFGSMDMDAYFRTLHGLGEHDADDVLPSIRVPTLMITGDRDLMTPPRTAKQIVDRIPGAELLVVKGGTHYAAVEYPELVNLRLERFLREHGL
jgi:pimeloyl-ACP methyl ester carboxylesterase